MPPRPDMRFWDPKGEKFGVPTWPWKLGPSPDQWATERQLAARGLRPGGQGVPGQLGWLRRGEEMFTALYRVDKALPKRPMTPAKWRAVRAALAARRICPECGRDAGYQIPRRRGACNPCFDGTGHRAETEHTVPICETGRRPSTDQSDRPAPVPHHSLDKEAQPA
jgi:hypothetical protein